MPKLILFVRRKPGLTHEQFRAHYEATHAPLAKRNLAHLVRYARNYLAPFPGQPEPPYDCVTEFWFDDAAGLQASLDWTRSEEGQILARDEENFMDRSTMITFIADEVDTPSMEGATQ